MGLSIFGTLDVKAIIEYGGLTSVPMMPGFARKVINTPLFAMSAQASPPTPAFARQDMTTLFKNIGLAS